MVPIAVRPFFCSSFNWKLDNEMIPESALDLVLYSEICDIGCGFGAGSKGSEDAILRFGRYKSAGSGPRRLWWL